MLKKNFIPYAFICILHVITPAVSNTSLFQKISNIGLHTAFFGCLANMAFSYMQIQKIHKLKDQCRDAENNSLSSIKKDHENIIHHVNTIPNSILLKQALIKCIEQKEKNLDNYYDCVDLVKNAGFFKPRKKSA
ncbi:hypothetical protein EKK58_03910 [Candidatus Dependentiae bacterium]|nr:MAG: hypothetical protein EKK58_03910 [Candidatus Dependentiae bacterium]